MTIESKPKSWLPSPTDKYLPMWVVGVMTVAVWLLSAQMASVIEKVCKIENRCHDSTVLRGDSTVTEVVGSAVKQVVKAQVAQSIADGASAVASTPAAAKPK